MIKIKRISVFLFVIIAFLGLGFSAISDTGNQGAVITTQTQLSTPDNSNSSGTQTNNSVSYSQYQQLIQQLETLQENYAALEQRYETLQRKIGEEVIVIEEVIPVPISQPPNESSSESPNESPENQTIALDETSLTPNSEPIICSQLSENSCLQENTLCKPEYQTISRWWWFNSKTFQRCLDYNAQETPLLQEDIRVESSPLVNGVCGSSNTATLPSIPSTNLCSSGTPSAVSGGSSWTWRCLGSNGGVSADCSARPNLNCQPATISDGIGSCALTGANNGEVRSCTYQKPLAPLYQYSNGRDHLYSTNPNLNNGYTREGITGYIYTSEQIGTVALNQFWNEKSGDHLYSRETSYAGYIKEGPVGYVYPIAQPNTIHLSQVQAVSGKTITDHFYTTNPSPFISDKNFIVSNHGVSKIGYIYPSNIPQTLLRTCQQNIWKEPIINGVCGSKNKVYDGFPINYQEYCSSGNIILEKGIFWKWSCVGSGGGITSKCSFGWNAGF